jgi:hypothetical protein
MTILFPAGEAWDGNRDVISFPADMNNLRIRCAVSLEALEDHFGGDNISPLNTFHAKRSVIEGVAERLINQQRFEQDGSILIRSQNC